MQEVNGSIPFTSTKILRQILRNAANLFFLENPGQALLFDRGSDTIQTLLGV